jgi:hypothetical protein
MLGSSATQNVLSTKFWRNPSIISTNVAASFLFLLLLLLLLFYFFKISLLKGLPQLGREFSPVSSFKECRVILTKGT